jgi:hypothetical protein
VTVIYIGEPPIWGFRIDFVVDHHQEALTGLPAIAIKHGKTLRRRP